MRCGTRTGTRTRKGRLHATRMPASIHAVLTPAYGLHRTEEHAHTEGVLLFRSSALAIRSGTANRASAGR
eukprot:jgi/Psemu1/305743/fgenesh1_kg.216_\